MKKIHLLLAVFAFSMPVNAQSLAVVNENAPKTTAFSNANFIAYREHRRLNKKVLWGGITSASGAVVSFAGLMWYSWGVGDGEDRPDNQSMQNTGKGLMVAGGVMAITGFVLMINGKLENKSRYGLQLIAPKNNEIGFAYTFR